VALNFLFADFPGMISWKKLNRGNLLRFPDLNVQPSSLADTTASCAVSGCSGMMQAERLRVDPHERGAPAKW
jgi:hypothetical protein